MSRCVRRFLVAPAIAVLAIILPETVVPHPHCPPTYMVTVIDVAGTHGYDLASYC